MVCAECASDIVEHANAVAMKTTEAEYWLKTQQQLNLDAERFYEFFREAKAAEINKLLMSSELTDDGRFYLFLLTLRLTCDKIDYSDDFVKAHGKQTPGQFKIIEGSMFSSGPDGYMASLIAQEKMTITVLHLSRKMRRITSVSHIYFGRRGDDFQPVWYLGDSKRYPTNLPVAIVSNVVGYDCREQNDPKSLGQTIAAYHERCQARRVACTDVEWSTCPEVSPCVA